MTSSRSIHYVKKLKPTFKRVPFSQIKVGETFQLESDVPEKDRRILPRKGKRFFICTHCGGTLLNIQYEEGDFGHLCLDRIVYV